MEKDDQMPQRATNKQTLIELLGEVAHHRTGNAIRYKLKDVLLIGLLCIICNGDTFTDMELFGKTHEQMLRQFLDLPHGIPSLDAFGDVFSKLSPAHVSKCFVQWTDALKDEMEQHQIAIDGKTMRGSHDGTQAPSTW